MYTQKERQELIDGYRRTEKSLIEILNGQYNIYRTKSKSKSKGKEQSNG